MGVHERLLDDDPLERMGLCYLARLHILVSSMPGRDDDKDRESTTCESTRIIDTYVGLVVGSRDDIAR